MESFDRMNLAIDQLEEQLLEDNGIDYNSLATIAGCSTQQFPRIFSFMAGMTLGEYIRRRRLSLAALELRGTGAAVVDIALKYGYESHAAFTRAFQDQHGITPSAARDGLRPFKLFPRLHFQEPLEMDGRLTYRIEKGDVKMARVVKLEFQEFGPYLMVGKSVRTKPMTQDIAMLWGRCFGDGTFDRLMGMDSWIPTEIADDYVGFMTDFDPKDGSMTYIVGMFMKSGAPVPDGFTGVDIPACTLARTWIQGEEYEIYANGHALTVEAIQQSGHEVDWQNFFQCEIYSDERFGTPKGNGEKNLILDYCMPCRA